MIELNDIALPPNHRIKVGKPIRRNQIKYQEVRVLWRPHWWSYDQTVVKVDVFDGNLTEGDLEEFKRRVSEYVESRVFEKSKPVIRPGWHP